jgi:hypothetical protein
MRRILGRVGASVSAVLATLGVVACSASPGWTAGKGLCVADWDKFCKHIKRNEEQLLFECLQAHRTELAPACRDLLGGTAFSLQTNAKAPAGTGPCVDDRKKLCPDATGAGVLACLRRHETELSAACKANLDRLGAKPKEPASAPGNEGMLGRPGAKGRTKVCAADQKKFCNDVKPGEGRVVQCLLKHEESLSPACRSFLTQKKGPAPANRP